MTANDSSEKEDKHEEDADENQQSRDYSYN